VTISDLLGAIGPVAIAISEVSLSDTLFDPGRHVLLATGSNFPDALGAAAVAARLNVTLILTAPTRASVPATRYLSLRSPSAITVLGGVNSVSRRTESVFAMGFLG